LQRFARLKMTPTRTFEDAQTKLFAKLRAAGNQGQWVATELLMATRRHRLAPTDGLFL